MLSRVGNVLYSIAFIVLLLIVLVELKECMAGL